MKSCKGVGEENGFSLSLVGPGGIRQRLHQIMDHLQPPVVNQETYQRLSAIVDAYIQDAAAAIAGNHSGCCCPDGKDGISK